LTLKQRNSKKLQKRLKKKVSVIGIDKLRGDCMAVPADLMVIEIYFCLGPKIQDFLLKVSRADLQK
jgi:hypothetical protein